MPKPFQVVVTDLVTGNPEPEIRILGDVADVRVVAATTEEDLAGKIADIVKDFRTKNAVDESFDSLCLFVRVLFVRVLCFDDSGCSFASPNFMPRERGRDSKGRARVPLNR